MKHVENLSDEKTIQAIQENPYMQYLLGLSKFTEKPVFVPELFVLIPSALTRTSSACFFAKNARKLLRGLLGLVFAKTGLETLKKRILSTIDDLVGVLPSPQVSWARIN